MSDRKVLFVGASWQLAPQCHGQVTNLSYGFLGGSQTFVVNEGGTAIDREELTKALRLVEEREVRLDATLERLEHWLWDETFHHWPEHSRICGFKGFPPDRFVAPHRVQISMDIATQYPDGKQVHIKEVIFFSMLQLATCPACVRVVGRCRALPQALDYFDGLWVKMLRQFGADEAQAMGLAVEKRQPDD